jgi:MFS family permease
VIRSALPGRAEARRLLLGTLFSSIGNGMTLPFLFVYLHQVRGIDATLVGLISGWMGLLALLGAGPIGWMIDHFGSRRVLLPLYGVAAVGQFSWGFDHSAWQAFVSSSLAACASATFLGYNTLLTTVTEPQERHHAFSLNFLLLNLGIGVGGAIAGFISDVHHVSSFRLLYAIDGASWVIPAVVLLSLPKVGQRLVSRKQVQEGGGYRRVLANRPFRRYIGFSLLLSACGYAQIEVGLPAFATTVGRVSTQVVAWGLVVNTIVIVLGQLSMTNRLTGRSRSKALAVAALIMAVAWTVLGIGCFGRDLAAALPIVGVLLCDGIFGFAETIFQPLGPALNNALATDELRGRYNALGTMSWAAMAVVGPITAGPLVGNNLGGVWFVLVVVGSLCAAAVARSIYRMLTPDQDGRTPRHGAPAPSQGQLVESV